MPEYSTKRQLVWQFDNFEARLGIKFYKFQSKAISVRMAFAVPPVIINC